ncbi:hypothetical protein GC194_01230 [bacterium]|nr:hypothetical protein [bacterium]
MNCFISAQRRVLSRAENSEEHAMEVFDTIIGDECLMGSGVIIVEGSEIGKGCVIAAGAVISGIYGDNLFFAGNPARAIPKKNMNG